MKNQKNIFNVNNTYLPIIRTCSPEPRSECPGFDSLIEINRYSLNLTTLYRTALRTGGLGNLQLDYGDIRGGWSMLGINSWRRGKHTTLSSVLNISKPADDNPTLKVLNN